MEHLTFFSHWARGKGLEALLLAIGAVLIARFAHWVSGQYRAVVERDVRAQIERGGVQCSEFPFVVLTSNGEREFPPAFLRRCIRVVLPDPGPTQLGRIVAAHLGQSLADSLQAQIKAFAEGGASRATDQLLNAIYLVHRGGEMEAATREKLEALLLQSIQRS